MVVQTQLQYREIPELGIYLASTKALDERGNPIVNITWYDAKLWVQERGIFLPTSRQWSDSRTYLEQNDPEIERDMITGSTEWVDSLIAWPNSRENYASNLNPHPKSGRIPILIQGSAVDKRRTGGYVIDGGDREELPDFPDSSGRLSKPIQVLGLASQAYLRSNPDSNYDQGLRAVIRGNGWNPHEWRFNADASWRPSYSNSGLGFRPARRGLVGAEAEGK